jgi:hypothetical protein
MPRYFFHLECHEERITDKRGQVLPNEDVALREAKEITAALRNYRGERWWVVVTNEAGHEVTQAPAEALFDCTILIVLPKSRIMRQRQSEF